MSDVPSSSDATPAFDRQLAFLALRLPLGVNRFSLDAWLRGGRS
jgi:hypothetical protein